MTPGTPLRWHRSNNPLRCSPERPCLDCAEVTVPAVATALQEAAMPSAWRALYALHDQATAHAGTDHTEDILGCGCDDCSFAAVQAVVEALWLADSPALWDGYYSLGYYAASVAFGYKETA